MPAFWTAHAGLDHACMIKARTMCKNVGVRFRISLQSNLYYHFDSWSHEQVSPRRLFHVSGSPLNMNKCHLAGSSTSVGRPWTWTSVTSQALPRQWVALEHEQVSPRRLFHVSGSPLNMNKCHLAGSSTSVGRPWTWTSVTSQALPRQWVALEHEQVSPRRLFHVSGSPLNMNKCHLAGSSTSVGCPWTWTSVTSQALPRQWVALEHEQYIYRHRNAFYTTLNCYSSGGERKLVYNGSLESHMDADPALLPYTQYEYMVAAVNSQGMASSQWAVVTTKEAPPQDVPSPLVMVRCTSLKSLLIFLVMVRCTTFESILLFNYKNGQSTVATNTTFYLLPTMCMCFISGHRALVIVIKICI